MNIKSKLPKIGTTIFSEMSFLANKHNALNLSQGFPDFKISDELPKLVEKHMRQNKNQYAPMPGVIDLRETLVDILNNNHQVKFDVNSEITITAGATQAIYTTISALISSGDEVIMFAPAYDCYAPAIEVNGGVCKFVNLNYPSYSIDWEFVNSIITDKTKMIIVNTPHNPTGAVFSENDILELENIVEKFGVIVLSDEVYEQIVFDDKKHLSVLKSDILVRNSVVVYSFGKSLHVTGWKLGFCVAPQNIMREIRKIHQFNVFSCNTPMQYAINDYLKNKNPYKNVSVFFQKKRDLFLKSIQGSRFKIVPTSGTYFQLLDYSNITNISDVEFAKELTIKNKIASIPVSVFYPNNEGDVSNNNLNYLNDKVLRFCFAKKDETLIKAGEILCKI